MSLDDIRRRMRGDEEAADILFVWLADQRRRQQQQQQASTNKAPGPRFPTGPLVDPDL